MPEKKLNEIIIHCHFDGEPSPELIEALNRMADLAAKNLGTGINNVNTEKRVANCGAPLEVKEQCDFSSGFLCKCNQSCFYQQFT